MRIRYVVFNAYAVGGTVRSVVNQANALCAEHDVEIVSVYRTRERPPFAIDPRVTLVPLTGRQRRRQRRRRLTRVFPNPLPHRHDFRFRRWDPLVDLKLVRYFRSLEDGVLVTTRPGLTLLAAATAPRRLVRVAQDHRSHASYLPAEREALVRAYRRIDAVTVLTEHDRVFYQQALAGSGARLERLPNGIPRPRHPPARLRSGIIVAAGRLEHEKGFDLLLDAFQTVAAKYPRWRLRIYGAGRERRDLAARVEQLGLTGRAFLRGSTRRLDRRLSVASMFVLSSRQEGLPMVLLEAMAAGLPVVAFDCPTGPAEIITHGRSGLLIPAEDVAALADGIGQLIEDRARRRAMGAAALADSQRYSIAAVGRQWERLLLDLTAARSLPRGG